MFSPYIRFNGACEEAFLWYAQLFNGNIQHMSKYDEMSENPNFPIPAELKNKVMHARLAISEFDGITGADYPELIEKMSLSKPIYLKRLWLDISFRSYPMKESLSQQSPAIPHPMTAVSAAV